MRLRIAFTIDLTRNKGAGEYGRESGVDSLVERAEPWPIGFRRAEDE